MKPSTENGKKGAWIRGVWHPNNYHSETHIPKVIKEQWFVMNSERDVGFYNTEQEAHDRFLKCIDEEREYCQEDVEWNIEVEYITWGKVFQDVVLRKVPSPYNEGIDPSDEDYDTQEYYDAFANERRQEEAKRG